MDSGMTVGLEQEIVAELTAELEITDKNFNPALLAPKVRNAIREVRMKRNYTATSYSEKKIEEDLYNYYSVVKDLALYDYSHIGGYFESSHNENSTSRSWISRDEILKGVHAFVKVL